MRGLVGDRRVTIAFDRGGYSPRRFKKLIDDGFDVRTYRKGRTPRIQQRFFERHHGVIVGSDVDGVACQCSRRAGTQGLVAGTT